MFESNFKSFLKENSQEDILPEASAQLGLKGGPLLSRQLKNNLGATHRLRGRLWASAGRAAVPPPPGHLMALGDCRAGCVPQVHLCPHDGPVLSPGARPSAHNDLGPNGLCRALVTQTRVLLPPSALPLIQGPRQGPWELGCSQCHPQCCHTPTPSTHIHTETHTSHILTHLPA